jgi:hypothetical protein
MRKIVIFIAGVAVLAAPVYIWGTEFGDVVSSFKSPAATPGGVSYRPGFLYISAATGGAIWRTDTTGSVISYHPTSLVNNAGITVGTIRGKTYYWVVDRVDVYTGYVYRFIDNSSTVDGSFALPGRYAWGVSLIDSTHMYYSATMDYKIYVIHPMNGSVYSSFTVDFYPGDLAYDEEGYLWVAGSATADKHVYKCTTTGSVLASFSAKKWGNPYGCGYDGEYLWVGGSDWERGRYTIVQFNVHEYPAVVPASVGRVKALFR